MTCWTKFSPKWFFQSKKGKVKITIEFWIFKLVWVPNFSLSWQFWLFGLNFPKMVFTVKIKNSENHGEFCICNLGIKSHFNQAILNLATKFVQKVYFQFKSDKSHFCMSPWLLLTRVQLIFLKWCCENLSFCNLISSEQQWKYIYSPANSPSPKGNIFLTVTGNKFIARNYRFSDPNNIYLFKLSNSSITKDKTCSKLAIEGPDFILVSLLFTLNISDRLF